MVDNACLVRFISNFFGVFGSLWQDVGDGEWAILASKKLDVVVCTDDIVLFVGRHF